MRRRAWALSRTGLRRVAVGAVIALAAAATATAAGSTQAPTTTRLLIVASAPPTSRPVGHIYDLSGRLLRTVDGPRGGSLAWSPDGSMIAITDSAGVWVERSDGTGRRRLLSIRTTCSTSCLGGPIVAWTPDGTRLAVGGIDPNTTGFGLVTVRTGQMKMLARPKRYVFHTPIAFSPDGRLLAEAVSGGRGGTSSCCLSELVVSHADGTAPRVLHKFGDPIHDGPGAATWSPNSALIAFTDDGRDPRDPRLAIADVRSGQLHRLDARSVYDQSPAWSSDGKRLALAQSDGAVFTIGTDGSDYQSLGVQGVATLWLHNGEIAVATGKSGHMIAILRHGTAPHTLFTLPDREQILNLREAR